ncbi:hypothetical protein C5167_047423 [Papaver somniferum]|uniref:RRM domain-containing protein n=1 Tax=Papaver somniferum TaxID=3469 RepID=A0A4Y7LJI6_PAPSO|nr:28 kDa ribonucleoprotein, chloroplastic-like [Papaver somniferum]RZC84638.1 hypothetical protein C5167_047423 [Papaver somniferum]
MANTAAAAVAGSLLIFKTTTTTTKNTSSYPSPKNRTILTSLSSSTRPSSSSSLLHNPYAAILFSSSPINNTVDILPIANKFRNFRVLASEVTSTATTTEEEVGKDGDQSATATLSQLAKVEGTIVQRPPFELYVCNLPRSVGDSELTEMFKPYGPIQSIEVARNAETGISKGWSYVVMSSLAEAKAAIMALDGSDVDGREMRVKFSNAMVVKRVLEAAKKKKKNNSTVMIFETPHKIYVGNLAWSVKPEELKIHFGQFGTVVSTRVLYDRKAGKNRVYAFLSFSTASECETAIAGANGTELQGRKMTVRQVVKPSTSSDSSEP